MQDRKMRSTQVSGSSVFVVESTRALGDEDAGGEGQHAASTAIVMTDKEHILNKTDLDSRGRAQEGEDKGGRLQKARSNREQTDGRTWATAKALDLSPSRLHARHLSAPAYHQAFTAVVWSNGWRKTSATRQMFRTTSEQEQVTMHTHLILSSPPTCRPMRPGRAVARAVARIALLIAQYSVCIVFDNCGSFAPLWPACSASVADQAHDGRNLVLHSPPPPESWPRSAGGSSHRSRTLAALVDPDA
ncbi:hypothetical protein CFE70_002406 [Pyrenophora teres f. teres 0-1]